MGWLIVGLSLARQGRWGTAIALWIVAGPCLFIAVQSWTHYTPQGGDANIYNDMGMALGLGGYLMLSIVSELEARKAQRPS